MFKYTRTIYLFIILNVLNMFDAVSTYFLLKSDNGIIEANPIMDYVIQHLGAAGFFFTKFILVAPASLYLSISKKHQNTRIVKLFFAMGIIVYSLVACWHILFWIL